MMQVGNNDREVLQELFGKVGEISADPRYARLRKEWVAHNDLTSQQAPRVLIFPDHDGVWEELLPAETMVVSDPFLQGIEAALRKKIYHAEHFRDDFVIEPDILVEIPGSYSGHHFGFHEQKKAWGLNLIGDQMTDAHGSYGFSPVLNSPEDYEKFLDHKLDFTIDFQEWDRRKQLLKEIFPETVIRWEIPYVALVCSLVIELVHLRGLQNIYLDLYDNPELLHRVLAHMGDQKEQLLLRLEEQGLLQLNNRDHWTGSGGVGYSDQLTESLADRPGLTNLWGFADAQEFSDVSVGMWKDFVLKNQVKGLRHFGNACYGCCEPLDGKYDALFQDLGNIRRLSVSPWADIYEAAEAIGAKAIYSRKPNPAKVCFGFDHDALKTEMQQFCDITKHNFTEIILKDLRSCNGDPQPLIDWVNITQEICKGA